MSSDRIKIFISHASEDKKELCDSLAAALKEDFDVWYDRYVLTIGDSLHGKISEGLRESDFGIVVLSKRFFAKKWPQTELDGLLALEDVNKKVILPVWHNVSEEDVRAFSPPLAGRLGIDSSKGIAEIVNEVRLAVSASERTRSFSSTENFAARFLKIDAGLHREDQSNRLLRSIEGVNAVRDSALALFECIKETIKSVSLQTARLKILEGDSDFQHGRICQGFRGPNGVTLVYEYYNSVINTAEMASLTIRVWNLKRDMWGDVNERELLEELRVHPRISSGKTVEWSQEDGTVFTSDQIHHLALDLFIQRIEGSFAETQ